MVPPVVLIDLLKNELKMSLNLFPKNFPKSFKKSIVPILVGSLSLVSCSKNSTDIVLEETLNGKVIATRSQNMARVIKVIELEGKPLSERFTKIGGKLNVSKRYANELQREHEKFKVKLAERIPEAKIVFDYYFALNGLAISLPQAKVEALGEMTEVKGIQSFSLFKNDKITEFSQSNDIESFAVDENRTSASFIGSKAAAELGITGEGIRIAVIDSGIDYTHKMFGGVGTKEAFKAVDASVADDNFPTEKVVGGYDFVGGDYDPSSVDPNKLIPKPDANPIDQTGHGSHVAGTIAGIGDGIKTYNGVAPDAKLFAFKVFGGPTGTTAEYVVAKALERALDPNGDFDISDRVDVVNMSLGELYGTDESLYQRASQVLHKAGVTVVAAAGNSGNKPFVVGIPGTVDENISVAASVDNSPHIVDYDAVSFEVNGEQILSPFGQGIKTRKLKDIEELKGEVVYLGTGKDLSEEVLEAVEGKVAVFDRGENSFEDKFKAVSSYGVLGVVILNTENGILNMTSKRVFGFPAVMVPKFVGDEIKDKINNQETIIFDFKPTEKYKNDGIVDRITDFSSRGPRLQDAGFKPEITAPGFQVISAKAGSGDDARASNGTSMASPHVAGAVALLKQKRPGLSPDEIKAILMNSSKFLVHGDYFEPVTFQGSGRIDILKALEQRVTTYPAGLSLGILQTTEGKEVTRRVEIKNSSSEELTLKVKALLSDNLKLLSKIEELVVPAESSIFVDLKFEMNLKEEDEALVELGGRISFVDSEGEEVTHMAVLGVLRKVSDIKLNKALSTAANKVDQYLGDVNFEFQNLSTHEGNAIVLNHLVDDEIRQDTLLDHKTNECDLIKAGYRILEKSVEDARGNSKIVNSLQFGVKLRGQLTNWTFCDVSVLIDINRDDIPDYEIAGTKASNIPGLQGDTFVSFLLDMHKAKEIRLQWEESYLAPSPIFGGGIGGFIPLDPGARPVFGPGHAPVSENYVPAIVDYGEMYAPMNSSVSLIETPVEFLQAMVGGKIRFKILTTSKFRSSIEIDDYAGADWLEVSLKENDQTVMVRDEFIKVPGNSTVETALTKGTGDGKLMVLFPENAAIKSETTPDPQGGVAEIGGEETVP